MCIFRSSRHNETIRRHKGVSEGTGYHRQCMDWIIEDQRETEL